MRVIDLFAGPGGWDVAGVGLGLRPLGIEWDDAACATREAAGLWTLQADIAELVPARVVAEHFDGCAFYGTSAIEGLIASPPCQAFSMAGKGEGRAAMPIYKDAIDRMAFEAKSVPREELDELCGDERAHLVLEPLRWALALRPRWIALEQVKPVLPLWEAMAHALRHHGYSAWTGILSAECYGVPQTRERAILIASLDHEVQMPEATHQRYFPPRRREEQEMGLFDAPEPARIVRPEDRHLLPWVSMAEALGWCGGEVGFPRLADNEHATEDGYRERDLRPVDQPAFALTEKARSWVRFVNGNQPNAAERTLDEPAPTITFGHNAARIQWVVQTNNFTAIARDADGGRSREGSVPYERPVTDPAPTVSSAAGGWKLRAGTNEHDAERDVDEPAPTLRFGERLNTVAWQPPPEAYDSRGQRDGKTGKPNRMRTVDEPAPTIAVESRNDSWVVKSNNSTKGGTRDGLERSADEPARTVDSTTRQWTVDRSATTVAGDARVHPPGHKVNADDLAAGRDEYEGRAGENAIRVTPQEASVLQSFPPNYPWQGTKSKQFEQIGNAIPPLLALRILQVVV